MEQIILQRSKYDIDKITKAITLPILTISLVLACSWTMWISIAGFQVDFDGLSMGFNGFFP